MEIASFAIIGAVVSLIVQYLKAKWGADSSMTILAVVVLSVIAGLGYYLVANTSLWQPMVQVLAFASSVYALIIKRFEPTE